MRKTREKRSMKRVKWIGAALLLLIAVLAWRFGYEPSEPSAVELPGEADVVRVMILGVDQRKDDVGRSDTLMIASLRTAQEKGNLLSIPRDTRVAIKGHGYDKINHAFAYGGKGLTQKTVEDLLGVPVDHYVIIDTRAFERIVDIIGGVDLNVEKRMYYEDPWDDNGGLVIDLYPGEQHLDGYHAIQYVRYRDGEGDIGRIARQQKFMRAMLSQILSPAILPALPGLVEEIQGAVETDMTAAEFLQFASALEAVRANGLVSEMLPGSPAYLSDISYWVPDIVALRTMLAEDVGLPLTGELQASAERAEREYRESLPKDIRLVEAEPKESGAKEPKESSAGKKAMEKAKESAEAPRPEEEDEKPMRPEEISVMVINSSGINGAGAEVAGILQRKGFVISGVETGRTDSWEQTTITTSSRNTDVFYGMPFPCIIMDGGGKAQAVVTIGRDYGALRQ